MIVDYRIYFSVIFACLLLSVVNTQSSKDHPIKSKQLKENESFFDLILTIIKKIYEKIILPLLSGTKQKRQSLPGLETILSLAPLIQFIDFSSILQNINTNFEDTSEPYQKSDRNITDRYDTDENLEVDNFANLLSNIFSKNLEDAFKKEEEPTKVQEKKKEKVEL